MKRLLIVLVTGLALLAWGPARADFIPLGDLPGGSFSSRATGVSADGSVVVGVGVSASGVEAFRWTAATGLVGLGDLPGGSFFSEALGVSADGSLVVGVGFSASGREAFIWDEANGMRSLRDVLIAQGDDLTGWTLLSADAISADGSTIVGKGINPSGQFEAWLARLGPTEVIPEPASLTLLTVGLGVLGLTGYHRRRQKRPRVPSSAI